jgi:hypothetical protein
MNAWSWAGIATTAIGAGLVIWAVWKVAWHEAGGWHGHWPASWCQCLHPRQAHLHYRPGTECSVPKCDCPRFRRADWDQGYIKELHPHG